MRPREASVNTDGQSIATQVLNQLRMEGEGNTEEKNCPNNVYRHIVQFASMPVDKMSPSA